VKHAEENADEFENLVLGEAVGSKVTEGKTKG